MTIFEEGVKAKKEGKSYNDNPYISGKTKLGNIILNETGGVWLSGFNSIGNQKRNHGSRQFGCFSLS